MITVYIGDTDSISVDNQVFDKNTPSYVKPHTRGNISERNDFAPYADGDPYLGKKRFVYVNMPADFELFLAGLYVLKRIQSLYPRSPLFATCSKDYIGLLPDGVQSANYFDSSMKANIYREYDLNLFGRNKLEQLNKFVTLTYENIMLELQGLFVPQTDMKRPPELLNKDQGNRSGIAIFKSGDNKLNSWEHLSKSLMDEDLSGVDIEYHEKPKYDATSIKKYISLFKKYRYCIFCGDSKLALLAGYMGCEFFTLVNETEYPKLKQYAHFKGKAISMQMPSDNLSVLVKKLVDKMKALSSTKTHVSVELQKEKKFKKKDKKKDQENNN